MPNWCWNYLTITGEAEQLAKFKKQAKQKRFTPDDKETGRKDLRPLQFNNFVPMDRKLLDGEGWYNWRIENWGTKWDLNEPSLDDTQEKDGILIYTFDTAWTYPLAWLEQASEQYPSLQFELEYEEGGMEFCGVLHAENGSVYNEELEWVNTCENCGDRCESGEFITENEQVFCEACFKEEN